MGRVGEPVAWTCDVATEAIKVGVQRWKKTAENIQTTGQKVMLMIGLRNTGPNLRFGRDAVTVEHDHAVEMIRQHPRAH